MTIPIGLGSDYKVSIKVGHDLIAVPVLLRLPGRHLAMTALAEKSCHMLFQGSDVRIHLNPNVGIL